MNEAEKSALANRILSVLAELYADQMGVEIKYEIVTNEGSANNEGF